MKCVDGRRKQGCFSKAYSNLKRNEPLIFCLQLSSKTQLAFKLIRSSLGFRLKNTPMINSVRLRKLMAVLALAILVTTLSGVGQKCAFKKRARAPLYSLFTKGLRFFQQIFGDYHLTDYITHLFHFIKSVL